MKTHMGISTHSKYKMHLTHCIFKTVKTVSYLSCHEKWKHNHAPHSCPTFFTCNHYGCDDKIEFYYRLFYFDQILYSISLLVCCRFYAPYKTVRVRVTNSKSRGNSTADTLELLTVSIFYKFSLQEDYFNLVLTGPDKYWIIKHSRDIILYYRR